MMTAENQNMEWKSSWHNDYLKWICGFANANGGTIYIGKNVPEQLNRKFRTRQIDFKGLQRIEKGEYPVAAIREMLLNALVHRNYMGSSVQLRVYDNKLTIWNEGNLPEGMDYESLKRTHSSRPRNPIIADVCFKAGYIDAWGRGTLKIYNSCKEAELPEPEIQPLDGGVLVTLYKDHLNEEQLRTLGMNERQIRAVHFVKENTSISNSDYQKLNDIGKTTATQELSRMVDLGIFTPPTAKGRGAKYTLS